MKILRTSSLCLGSNITGSLKKECEIKIYTAVISTDKNITKTKRAKNIKKW